MRRKLLAFEETFFKILMRISVLVIVLVLSLIIFSIFYKGIPSLSWEMISQTPKGGYYFGKGGGVLNAIVGSLYLAFGATLLAFVIGLPVALLINIHLKRQKRFVNFIRLILDILWGVPSIVYGAFGFTIMIMLGLKTSLLAGIITVALFILPIMIRTIDEVLKNVPAGLLEASFSLGSNKTQTAFMVYLRQCSSAIVTAIMMSFGRAIGDAASVLFTTGYTDNIPTSLTQPAATLPLSIFFQLSSPIPEVQNRAYASAAILTILILIISLLSRLLSNKYDKNKIS
ncbi:MAG TPA: phosphate ABC transporter permease PstA [Bacteroidales bacterium]|nr:phosphate ABC transporter permease PstA [Bacteroidales bacterium]